jgi:hypothetical protein
MTKYEWMKKYSINIDTNDPLYGILIEEFAKELNKNNAISFILNNEPVIIFINRWNEITITPPGPL